MLKDSFLHWNCLCTFKKKKSVQFLIVKTWKQPICPLTDEWIKKIYRYIYTQWNTCCLVIKSRLTFWWPHGLVACQTPLCMGFCREENWAGLPFPSPGDLPDSGINPCLLHWQAVSLPLSHQGSPQWNTTQTLCHLQQHEWT